MKDNKSIYIISANPKGNNNKECICSIRMDEPTLKRLEVYCEKMGILKSQAIREAIDTLTLDENTKAITGG